MTCVQNIDCPLYSIKTDVATKGVTMGVTIEVWHVCADWSSLNFLAKANFRIEITKVWAHGNAWSPARTFGLDRINQSRTDGSLLYKLWETSEASILSSPETCFYNKTQYYCKCGERIKNHPRVNMKFFIRSNGDMRWQTHVAILLKLHKQFLCSLKEAATLNCAHYNSAVDGHS